MVNEEEVVRQNPIENCYLKPCPESGHYLLCLKSHEGDDLLFHIHRGALLVRSGVVGDNIQATEDQASLKDVVQALGNISGELTQTQRFLMRINESVQALGPGDSRRV